MATLAACLPIETAAAGASAGPAAVTSGYAARAGLCAACRPADITRTSLRRRRTAGATSRTPAAPLAAATSALLLAASADLIA